MSTETQRNREATSSTALAGIRVLDFTHTLAGPFCTQMLADAGATVIKVEPPGGEFSRVRGAKRLGSNGDEVSTYSAAVNRNKRSIVIDLKSSVGLALAQRLAAQSDVLVENFAPGTVARLGLDFAELREANPNLITASISLFGGVERAGTMASRGGLAIVAEAEGALTDGMRLDDGRPQLLRFPLGDMGTGLAAYGAIVTALVERERTGHGRHLDVTMVGTLMALNSVALIRTQILRANDSADAQHNAVYGTWPPAAGIFKTRDDYVVVAVNTDALFHRLASAIGHEEWITDPRYATYREREKRGDEVHGLVEGWVASQLTDDVVDLCVQNRIPVGRIQSAADVADSPVIERLGLMPELEDGTGDTLKAPASATTFAQARPVIPRLAEHRDQILGDLLGLDAEAVDKLAVEGAFGR